MAKKRAKVDPDLFSSTERGPVQQPTPKADQRVDLKGRVTWQVGGQLKELIRQEAVRLGVPQSQLARYLLTIAWNDYVDGRVAPPPLFPSDSPAYRNVIDFEE